MNEIRVLVIDDEEGIRCSLKSFFEDEGFLVWTVSSAEAAEEFLDKNEVDIAIVDLRLPGIDGYQFIQKRYDINQNLRFIIYTGSPTETIFTNLSEKKRVAQKIYQKPLLDLTVLTKEIYTLIKK